MKGLFYPKLAWTGIRKNSKLFLPYILTCAGMVAMYYIICALSLSPMLTAMRGGGVARFILEFGTYVMALFAAAFLFYTNAFLLRRRKKEFGLYNILGMGKRNLAKILLWETVQLAGISFGGGLLCGILLLKFAELGLVNMLNGSISYDLYISGKAVRNTVLLFCIIFLLIFLNALRQIRLTNPINLLRSENVGEKPPKGNLFLGLAGVVLLVGAYVLALSVEDPMTAFFWFFIAVLLVILATYVIFIFGSVLLCRFLQKRKKYYYKPNHFVSVSSMAYRMKRNGAGLASICILATMVLVMLASTTCLYFGMDNSLAIRFPRDFAVEIFLKGNDSAEDDIQVARDTLNTYLADSGVATADLIEYRYDFITGLLTDDGDVQTDLDSVYDHSIGNAEKICQIYFFPLEDYNRLAGTEEKLSGGEALICTDRLSFAADTFSVNGSHPYRIAKEVDPISEISSLTADISPALIVIVPDFQEICTELTALSKWNGDREMQLSWYYGFNCTNLGHEAQLDLLDRFFADVYSPLRESIHTQGVRFHSLAYEQEDFLGTFGALLLLGILLSIAFLFATVLIVYYKQISEAYEDQPRFEVMQKIGMTPKEIRSNVNSQMLTVFILPLIFAVMHLGFAFPMICQLLLLFQLNDVLLFLTTAGISVLAFFFFYTIVYKLTSGIYVGIVSRRSSVAK